MLFSVHNCEKSIIDHSIRRKFIYTDYSERHIVNQKLFIGAS